MKATFQQDGEDDDWFPHLLEFTSSAVSLKDENSLFASHSTTLQDAIRLDEENTAALNGLARLYSTCRDAKIRDGKKTVELATKGCELSNWKSADEMDTLAAAYAETKAWDNAVQRQKHAIEAADNLEARKSANARFELYKKRQPLRENEWKPELPFTTFE